MTTVAQIDKKLAGHSVNFRIACEAVDFGRLLVIVELIDALLEQRQIAAKWTSPTGG